MRKNHFTKRFISMLCISALAFGMFTAPVFADEAEDAAAVPVSVTGNGVNPEYAADGNIETSWEATGSGELIVDLEKMYKISRIEIDWSDDSAEAYYKISKSIDKSHYQEIIDRSSCAEGDRTPNTTQNGSIKTSTDTLKFPLHTKYLKVSIDRTEPPQSKINICEIRVYGTESDDVNLALNKPITLTGGLAKSEAAKKNPKVFNDGDYESGVAGYDDNTRFAVPFGVIIDLGEICKISDIYCRFVDMQSERNYYSYTISGSMDGVNFGEPFASNKYQSNEYMIHNFLSNAEGNPYWDNGFCLYQNSVSDVTARCIKLDVQASSYEWAYGIREIEVMGKPDKSESLLGKITLQGEFKNLNGEKITTPSGENGVKASISAKNLSESDVTAVPVMGIYKDGMLTDIIKSAEMLDLKVQGSASTELTAEHSFKENESIAIWLIDKSGDMTPLTQKTQFGTCPNTDSVDLTKKDGVFETGYKDAAVSVKVDVGSVLGGRLAGLTLLSKDKTRVLAYEIIELDNNGIGETNFSIDTDSGNYTLALSVQGAGKEYGEMNTDFEYTNKVYFKRAMNAVYDAKTEDEMHSALTDELNIRNLSIKEQAAMYGSIGNKYTDIKLIEYLKAHPFESFETEDSFKEALKRAVEEYSLMGAANAGNMMPAFDKYGDKYNEYFGLSELKAYKDYYKRYSKNAQSAICSRLKNEEFKDKDDFVSLFKAAIFLGGIQNTDNWTEVKNIINNNTDFFGENNPSLSEVSDPSKVYSKMCGVNYADKNAVRAAEAALINEYKSSKNGGSGSTGGGGSSSGGRKSSGVYVAPSSGSGQSDDGGSGIAPEAEKTFNDMSGYEWARLPVMILYKQGIVNGTGNGEFSPAASVKREEFVKMLCMLFGVETASNEETFSDIPEGHWSIPYISAAKKQGLVMGKTQTLFGLGEDVTREEMAVMCYRFALAYGYEFSANDSIKGFRDSAKISEYAKEAVSYMKNAGIIKGRGDNEFAPADNAERAEAAMAVYNLFIYTKKHNGEI